MIRPERLTVKAAEALQQASTLARARGNPVINDAHLFLALLAQLVAIPTLRGTGKALDSLALSCPTTMGCAYSAYWDGYVGNTGKQAMSGVYIYQLVIDGKRVTRKIVVK